MKSLGRNLRTCFISTYPPRKCGIATYTKDLIQEISKVEGNIQGDVVAISSSVHGSDYAPEVIFEIKQNHLREYRLAAEYINFSSVDIVCLQHEFGIFGGIMGCYVLELLERLYKPVVTTLHTVETAPDPKSRDILNRIIELSDHIVVLNKKAILVLEDIYGVKNGGKISFIHHGAPDVPFVDPNYYKDKLRVEGRLVMLTFGLLSRNKGIEMVLEALPKVVKAHPEVIYIVLGATHPEVKRIEGEEYRLWLQRRVRELGLEEHVIFHDRYVDFRELIEYIGACDIYITTYKSKDQIVSGTLAYAVSMGKAVVSTPYSYAEELLAGGRGELVGFNDSVGLSNTLLKLIEKPALRHRMRKRAYEYGRKMVWSEVAKEYSKVFVKTASQAKHPVFQKWEPAGTTFEIPEIKLDYLVELTDETGILQHAAHGIGDWSFGYTTDDVARALVVSLLYNHQYNDEISYSLIKRYLRFLKYAQNPTGLFRNHLSFNRQFLDEHGTEDTLGRAIWGLGTAIMLGPDEDIRASVRDIFERALAAANLEHPRSIAYAICGLSNFLHRYDGASHVKKKLNDLANKLASWFKVLPPEWRWFGEEITYANARMPQAMLLAYKVTEKAKYKDIGLDSLDFLISETYRDGYFDFIGNHGWYKRGGKRSVFGQQTIESGYTAEACVTAYEVTQDDKYLGYARAAAEWLLGRNRLGARVYNLTTGACADGLDLHGVSLNKGAEATICGLLALLVVTMQSEKRIEKQLKLKQKV